MTSFIDKEFGEITIRRNARASSVRTRLGPRGQFIVSAPTHLPVIAIKQIIRASRAKLRELRSHHEQALFVDHQQIGQSHHITVVRSGMHDKPIVKLAKRDILVHVSEDDDIADPVLQEMIKAKVIIALRNESKAYLPRRVETLANRHGYQFTKLRFPHAISRWGSCSSDRTISLNIALMKLPLELIDYVILHELAHTLHMNHSKAFWDELASKDPHAKLHKSQLGLYSPII